MTRQCLTLKLIQAMIALTLLATVTAQSAQQSLDELKAATEQFLQDHYAHPEDSSASNEVNVAALDPRLRLTQCSTPLTFSVRDMGDDGGAISVKVQCQSEQPWSLYVSAKVDIYRNVLVAATPLGRGTLIDSAAITYQRFNTSLLRQGYFTSDSEVLGLQLRRPLATGEPLRTGVLEQPLAVKRGDIVTLESSNNSIQVATQAEALGSGRVGEQIRVRNTSSERVIKANILSKGRVGANF